MNLSHKQIEHAFNYYIEHAREDELRVGFVGGGEPTIAWKEFVHAVRYAKQRADDSGRNISFSIVSNGLWTAEQLDFIKRHFSSVTLSVDGNADINDSRRVRPDGTGTYDHVSAIARNIHDTSDVQLCFTPLITADTVDHMEEIIAFFCREYPKASIAVSMMRMHGARALNSGLKPPSASAFLRNLIKAELAMRARGYDNLIDNPFFNFDPSTMPHFCDAAGRNCIVTAGGNVTSCSSVVDESDNGADVFLIGKVDDEGIVFYEDRYRALADKLSVYSSDECSTCFASHVCRGGCPSAKASHKSFWKRRSEDCEAIKEALREYLCCIHEEG